MVWSRIIRSELLFTITRVPPVHRLLDKDTRIAALLCESKDLVLYQNENWGYFISHVLYAYSGFITSSSCSCGGKHGRLFLLSTQKEHLEEENDKFMVIFRRRYSRAFAFILDRALSSATYSRIDSIWFQLIILTLLLSLVDKNEMNNVFVLLLFIEKYSSDGYFAIMNNSGLPSRFLFTNSSLEHSTLFSQSPSVCLHIPLSIFVSLSL